MKQQDVSTSSVEAIVSNQQKRPTVLVFDSGVGGLSVYQEIWQLLPNLHYIYAFDNAGFPYGEKPEKIIVERVVKIVKAINQRYPLDIVIIACNTASTVSLPALREHFSIPVVGVVPAIKPAAKLTHNGVIGLLATRATVQRSYTHELIAQFAADSHIELLGTARLAEIAEEKLHGKGVNSDELTEILRPWLELATPPDTIVLGCTHFPLLKEELQNVLPAGTQLIDSGEAIAKRVAILLTCVDKYQSDDQQNIAVCTRLDNRVKVLLPILQQYGFAQLVEKNI